MFLCYGLFSKDYVDLFTKHYTRFYTSRSMGTVGCSIQCQSNNLWSLFHKVVNIGKYVSKNGKVSENNECRQARVIFRGPFPFLVNMGKYLRKKERVSENNSCLNGTRYFRAPFPFQVNIFPFKPQADKINYILYFH